MSPVGLAILARAPLAGQAKTRLIPALGAAGAARLAAWLLRRTLATAQAARIGPVSLWWVGAAAPTDFLARHELAGVHLARQPTGDLGQRMATALRHAATAQGALLIGSDCPALTAADLRAAALALRQHPTVIQPAEDGGYVLIGMRQVLDAAFAGIAWGSAQVMAQTRQRLRDAGQDWTEAASLWDVDRPEDLPRLFALCPEAEDA